MEQLLRESKVDSPSEKGEGGASNQLVMSAMNLGTRKEQHFVACLVIQIAMDTKFLSPQNSCAET